MTRKTNERYQIRKTAALVSMVNDLMRTRKYYSYSEMFRSLIREAWEKYCQTD